MLWYNVNRVILLRQKELIKNLPPMFFITVIAVIVFIKAFLGFKIKSSRWRYFHSYFYFYRNSEIYIYSIEDLIEETQVITTYLIGVTLYFAVTDFLITRVL